MLSVTFAGGFVNGQQHIWVGEWSKGTVQIMIVRDIWTKHCLLLKIENERGGRKKR